MRHLDSPGMMQHTKSSLARIIGVLGLLATLAGCAEHWAKPGGTKAELDFTKASCEAESHARFPPVLQQVMVQPPRMTPPETHCSTVNGKTHCRTFGGFWLPPSYQMIDLNESGRDSARTACLYRSGWILARDEKEAAAITRSGLEPTQTAIPPPRDRR